MKGHWSSIYIAWIASRGKNCHFYVPQPSYFVCPGDASVAINSVLAKPLTACTHLSSRVSQLFEPQVQKIAFSHTAAHIFVSPGDAPTITKQYVAQMERQFNACQTHRTMYPSIFNNFPVIRTANAKNCCFHAPQPTFLFPLETPLQLSRNMFHGWKYNWMLATPLAACTYVYSTVSKLYDA